MKEFNCCENSEWIYEIDFGHADSFEFDMGKCSLCGKLWMSVYCVSNHRMSYETIRPEDVENLLKIPDGKERKQAVRDWFYKNVD